MRTALLLTLLVACATPSPVHEHTYPRDFHYLTQREVRTAMERMARSTFALNELLREEGEISKEEQAEVVRLLGEIDESSAAIDTSGVETNHPIIDRNLATFRAEVAQAKEAARREPPNFYLAGAVTQSCLMCHGKPAK